MHIKLNKFSMMEVKQMSCWTFIRGTITVSPMGRSQAEKRYILEAVLAHLPKVTGSENDMNVYVIQKSGYDQYCSHDEFGQYSNLGNGNPSYRHPSFGVQCKYILAVDANLRDRTFAMTMREFSRWLCRLSKRLYVNDVLVEVNSDFDEQSHIFRNENNVFGEMFEWPSWCDKGESNWCEFMMWNRAKESDYPMMLAYKYFDDPENDAEVERRIKYDQEEG